MQDSSNYSLIQYMLDYTVYSVQYQLIHNVIVLNYKIITIYYRVSLFVLQDYYKEFVCWIVCNFLHCIFYSK